MTGTPDMSHHASPFQLPICDQYKETLSWVSAAKNAVVSQASQLRGISILCQFVSFLQTARQDKAEKAACQLLGIVQVYEGGGGVLLGSFSTNLDLW